MCRVTISGRTPENSPPLVFSVGRSWEEGFSILIRALAFLQQQQISFPLVLPVRDLFRPDSVQSESLDWWLP